MTHTAHRMGTEESLRMDYVALAIAARGFNHVGCSDRMKKIAEIFRKNNAVNFGDVKQGSIWRKGLSFDAIVNQLKDTSVIHGVFTNLEDVKKLVRDLKAADLGISVTVTGLFRDVFCAAQEAGVKPHCVGISLGLFGRTDKLPEREILEITTMCGHGMIGPNMVRKYIQDVQKGKVSSEEAGGNIARACMCGVFNPVRAAALIKNLAEVKAAAEETTS